jgi:hypothetical protein
MLKNNVQICGHECRHVIQYLRKKGLVEVILCGALGLLWVRKTERYSNCWERHALGEAGKGIARRQ